VKNPILPPEGSTKPLFLPACEGITDEYFPQQICEDILAFVNAYETANGDGRLYRPRKLEFRGALASACRTDVWRVAAPDSRRFSQDATVAGKTP
jgi:hypothetical protein